MAHSRAAAILYCTVLQVCFGTVYAWSFFQTLLVRQLGWSFTDTALAFSITIFSLGMSAAGAGMILPKVGPRRLALAGSVMFSGGYMIAGLALQLDSLALFYLGYGVIGGAGIGLGYVTPVATVAKWFPDKKGLATGIAVISFQSPLLQDVWGLADPSVEPETLAEYGATLIAASSLCNGFGRLFWGLLSDRIGRIRVFRILLASQMIVFGILMTERDPWIFSALVCYIMLCFGGGFATMPSFVLDVFGAKKMSAVYGIMLTAWAAAGVCGPLYIGYLKDQYPDRAIIYCFLIGVLILGLGYVFSYLLSDKRIRLQRPSVESTLREHGIAIPRHRRAS